MAVLSGGLTGNVLRCLTESAAPMADDSAYWDVADDFGYEVADSAGGAAPHSVNP